MKPLRVGIDVTVLLRLQGGISYYIFYLLDELIKQKRDCHFYLYTHTIEGEVVHFRQYSHVTIRKITFLSKILGFPIKSVLWRNSTLPFFLWKDRIEVFWITHFHISLLIPRSVKRILTIYDFVSDLFPETVSFLHRLYHRSITKGNLQRADYRTVISEGTGKRLKELFGMNYDAVVYPPHKTGLVYQEKSILEPFLV
ncbi:MAG: hypothetical protein ACHQT8_03180, partial [Chlamydiales bacterium]